MNTSRIISFIAMLFLSLNLMAADDPSIKGDLRQNVKKSMNQYITQNSSDASLWVYDAVDGQLLKLKFVALHEGIVKKGDFYVSCADFTDQKGRKIDIDFLVRPAGNQLNTTQALVHSVDGKKRNYHLESSP